MENDYPWQTVIVTLKIEIYFVNEFEKYIEFFFQKKTTPCFVSNVRSKLDFVLD